MVSKTTREEILDAYANLRELSKETDFEMTLVDSDERMTINATINGERWFALTAKGRTLSLKVFTGKDLEGLIRTIDANMVKDLVLVGGERRPAKLCTDRHGHVWFKNGRPNAGDVVLAETESGETVLCIYNRGFKSVGSLLKKGTAVKAVSWAWA